ncbi:MAG: PKD domain-containing protein [Crocinitomicaceae bacterium]|nr:PKD domain-containing protein [Crocinitomicaceae bacterium]MCF8433644.1 PKD domain-containing protein [Crocinitomicaceae bacterium]
MRNFISNILSIFLLCLFFPFIGNSQTVLWQNGFETPSQWTQTYGVNHTAGDWQFLTSLPNNILSQQGAYQWPATFSAATGNFVLINSDDAGSNTSQDAYLEYNSNINLTSLGTSPFELTFNDYYRTFIETTAVEISNDGGLNWFTYEVNSEVPTSTNCIDGEIESILISPFAGAWSNQVRIRFHYLGNWDWFWGVDNVKIKTLPNYNLVLNELSWGSTGASGIRIPYYKVPVSQIAPIEFAGSVSNWGIQNQNNVVLNVNTTNFSGNSIGTTINSGVTDTLICQTFTPPGIGTYSINTIVNSPNPDAIPANNAINNIATIEVTDLVYSVDNGLINPNFSGYSDNGYTEAGNVFDIFSNEVLNSIDLVPISGVSEEIYVKLYYYDPNSGLWILLNESIPYTINPNDIGSIISLPMITPQNINAGETYLAVAAFLSQFVDVAYATNPAEPFISWTSNDFGNSWVTLPSTPMVRMRFCNEYNASSSINVTQCDSYVSPAGNTYTSSGIYTDIIPVANGCGDSTITINLTINNSVQTSFSETICDGDIYTWNNQDYTYSGAFTQTFPAANGCDSIVTLDLTVNYNDAIQIQANPAFGNSPLNVAFNNQTSNLSDYNFTWYFGDGTSQQSNSPFLSHIYTQDAYSDVTVVAENITTGCVTSNIYNDLIFVIGGVTCTHTATLNQTGPLSTCVGDSILLSCNTDPSFSYQWNRNGVPVSGATSSSIYAQLGGSYTVTIYQNNCPVTSNGISVTINPLPSIPTITSTGTITSCSGGSLTLSAPAGSSSYSWNTGATTASISVTQSGNYAVTVTNSNGCAITSAPYVVNASFMSSPNVCVVGMDSLTNENRIVWEKPLTLGIDSFYVYKETNVSDVYTKIGATAYNDLAVFLDQNSNPAVQAYRYKLTVLDTCGTETLLSDFHKTIHLTINAGVGGAWNLIWSHYEGLTFGSYNIYRGTDPTNISLLTTIQSNLNSYTDLAPPVGPVYYQIEIVNPNSCDPTKVVNYSVSKSNIVNNGVNGINALANSTVHVYPNPTSKDVTLEITDELLGKDYYLTDNTGRIILSGQFRALKETINLEQISTGVYFIKIDNNANLIYKIVKN